MTQVLSKTSDPRLVQHDRSWEQFKHIQKGFEGSPGVRLFYYEGTIEILMPGLDHEFFKSVIGMLLELFFLAKEIEFAPTGSVTQERENVVSAQADESYCIGQPKTPPDLSIEVIFTSGSATKLQRYQALGVPEVWFWEDGVFSLYHLRAHGYERLERSAIPALATLDFAHLSRCVLLAETSRLEAARAFRQGL
ncbi:MAG: Uma2 family endonuclease [Stenomitos rutilans HA7619-LM2]|jgi:Uma2 family endonuclease|nr:Uma2 family endonuclease [Stenomitos rutilans HA7619-LM2]